MTSVHHWCSGLGSGQCTSGESSAVSLAGSVVRAAANPGPGGATGARIVGCDLGLFDTVGAGGVETGAIEARPDAGMVMASFLSRTMIGETVFGTSGWARKNNADRAHPSPDGVRRTEDQRGGTARPVVPHAVAVQAPRWVRRCSQCKPAGSVRSIARGRSCVACGGTDITSLLRLFIGLPGRVCGVRAGRVRVPATASAADSVAGESEA